MCALCSWKRCEISYALCSLGFIVRKGEFVESFVVVCLHCRKNQSTKHWCFLEAVFLLAKLLL